METPAIETDYHASELQTQCVHKQDTSASRLQKLTSLHLEKHLRLLSISFNKLGFKFSYKNIYVNSSINENKQNSVNNISEKLSSILSSDNNYEVIPSYKAQILSMNRNQDPLVLEIVQIFAQIDARTFSIFPLQNTSWKGERLNMENWAKFS